MCDREDLSICRMTRGGLVRLPNGPTTVVEAEAVDFDDEPVDDSLYVTTIADGDTWANATPADGRSPIRARDDFTDEDFDVIGYADNVMVVVFWDGSFDVLPAFLDEVVEFLGATTIDDEVVLDAVDELADKPLPPRGLQRGLQETNRGDNHIRHRWYQQTSAPKSRRSVARTRAVRVGRKGKERYIALLCADRENGQTWEDDRLFVDDEVEAKIPRHGLARLAADLDVSVEELVDYFTGIAAA